MWIIIIAIFCSILILLSFLGCIIPALPGPPLSFIALLLIAIVSDFSPPLTGNLIFIMFGVTLVVTAMDYFMPVLGAKKYGASKWGIWGSILGMLFGILYLPPLGMILGAFLGAVIAEMIAGKATSSAVKAGIGVFLGTLLGTILKLIVVSIMAYYFILALIQLL